MLRHQLQITGQVKIVPCTKLVDPRISRTILIMGPTGAGKSTFIEALSRSGQSLGISRDQLAGFTQNVSCFELKNACTHVKDSNSGTAYPIYLIDTPGFSDSKISEMEIINKVKSWMKDQRIGSIDNILYLSPITDTRVSGSKHRSIKMLQSLLRDQTASSATIVTTMWDRVINAHAKKRANNHFAQLQNVIWKDLVDQGAKVVRFQNDHKSAISIMTDVIKVTSFSSPLWDDPISVKDPSAPLLYQELLERIRNTHQEIEGLRIDQLQLIALPNPRLESVIVPQLQEARQTLAKFLGQLVQFGDPPPGFEGAPEQFVYQHLLDYVKNTQQDIVAFNNAKTQMPKFDWIRRSDITTSILKAESKLVELSKYLDASGNPQVPGGYDGLSEVLELLRPKVNIAGRMKAEFTSLTKKLTRH